MGRKPSFVYFCYGGLNVASKKDAKYPNRITLSGYLSQINSYKEIDEQFRTTNFIALN
jgi:hypothetical protein